MEAKPTVLAVDDTPSNLVALEAVLDKEFEVRAAHSGEEAIVVLQDVSEPVRIEADLADRIAKLVTSHP